MISQILNVLPKTFYQYNFLPVQNYQYNKRQYLFQELTVCTISRSL